MIRAGLTPEKLSEVGASFEGLRSAGERTEEGIAMMGTAFRRLSRAGRRRRAHLRRKRKLKG